MTRKQFSVKLLFWCVLLLSATNSKAQILVNGSFESSVIAANDNYRNVNPGSFEIPGWEVEKADIDIVRTYWSASDGSVSIDLHGFHSGAIAQDFNTIPDSTYYVFFDLSCNPVGGSKSRRIRVTAGTDTAEFETVKEGKDPTNMSWKNHLFSFKARSPISRLKFESLAADDPYGPAIDNVEVYTQVDCNTVPNGSAVIDKCGQCLEPQDPTFNQLCDENTKVYLPNAFTPGDGDVFRPVFVDGLITAIENFKVYNRWGEALFSNSGTEFQDVRFWWDGTTQGSDCPAGTYFYILDVRYYDNTVESISGSITLLR